MGADPELVTAAVTPLPRYVAVGRGTSLFVDGAVSFADDTRVARLEVGIDGVFTPALGWAMPLPATRHRGDYWWSLVDLDPVATAGEVELSLRAHRHDGTSNVSVIGGLRVRPDPEPVAAHEPGRAPEAEGPLVAICMATYEPDPEMFRVQIESIRAQTHRRWICLISDDGSSDAALERIRAEIDGDPRFTLASGHENAGFYRNFERALTMVGPEVDYVALADQDDRWYPEKIEALLAGLRPGSSLVYSDIRLVDGAGSVLSDTYWTMRRNNHTDFGSLVLANTVTGAACLFDARLLEDILPLPPRHSSLFHDHWIAQVAMALGPLSYVDSPLHDYVQHDEAAIGHFAANGLGRFSGPLRTRALTTYRRARDRNFRPAWRSPYFNVYLRVELSRRVLLARLGKRMSDDRIELLQRLGDPPVAARWLLRRSGRDLIGANETLGRERAILAGLAWRRMALLRRAISRRG